MTLERFMSLRTKDGIVVDCEVHSLWSSVGSEPVEVKCFRAAVYRMNHQSLCVGGGRYGYMVAKFSFLSHIADSEVGRSEFFSLFTEVPHND